MPPYDCRAFNKQGSCLSKSMPRITGDHRVTCAGLTHRVCIARSEVKVPLARVWILLSYSDSRERFCRSWKALARTQWILLAFSNLDKHMEGRRKSGSTYQSFFMNSFIIHSSWKTMHRYKVYFKVMTLLVSGSKICWRWYSGMYMSVLDQLCEWMCVFCLQ